MPSLLRTHTVYVDSLGRHSDGAARPGRVSVLLPGPIRKGDDETFHSSSCMRACVLLECCHFAACSRLPREKLHFFSVCKWKSSLYHVFKASAPNFRFFSVRSPSRLRRGSLSKIHIRTLSPIVVVCVCVFVAEGENYVTMLAFFHVPCPESERPEATEREG